LDQLVGTSEVVSGGDNVPVLPDTEESDDALRANLAEASVFEAAASSMKKAKARKRKKHIKKDEESAVEANVMPSDGEKEEQEEEEHEAEAAEADAEEEVKVDPACVPTGGRFFLHDDRFSDADTGKKVYLRCVSCCLAFAIINRSDVERGVLDSVVTMWSQTGGGRCGMPPKRKRLAGNGFTMVSLS
jgi:hypothetical protein